MPVKAPFTTIKKAAGSCVKCVKMTMMANNKYNPPIIGTSHSEYAAMRLTPPRTTIPVNIATNAPTYHGFKLYPSRRASAMELACKALPAVNPSSSVPTAKMTAIHLFFNMFAK